MRRSSPTLELSAQLVKGRRVTAAKRQIHRCCQPWLIYGLFHTRDGYSKVVSNGDAIFTLIGFTGLYFVIGLLFLGLTGREIGKGPEEPAVAISEPEREAVLV